MIHLAAFIVALTAGIYVGLMLGDRSYEARLCRAQWETMR